jgi:cobalt/nickel transport system permease protein
MHIPDGLFVNGAAVHATTAVVSAAACGVALWRAKKTLGPRQVPLLGVSAAFVFAAQMLNFPVVGGTSGHLIGGVLAAVLLGPSAAVVVLTAVLIVQCLVFGDGGVLTLGANVFNMALVSVVGGYAVYRAVWRLWPGRRGQLVAVAVASWAATVAAAIVCAGELALSHKVAWSVGFPIMAGIHALIGIGEAVITTMVIVAVRQARPDLLETPRGAAASRGPALGSVVVYGLLIALGLALFVAPFACSWPDGLEWAADKLGFAAAEAKPLLPAPLPDYQWRGLSPTVGKALAAAIGTLGVFALGLLAARLLFRRRGLSGRIGDNGI